MAVLRYSCCKEWHSFFCVKCVIFWLCLFLSVHNPCLFEGRLDSRQPCLFKMISKIKTLSVWIYTCLCHSLSPSFSLAVYCLGFSFYPSTFVLSINFITSASCILVNSKCSITVSYTIHLCLCTVLMRGLTLRSIQMCWSMLRDPANTSHQVRHPIFLCFLLDSVTCPIFPSSLSISLILTTKCNLHVSHSAWVSSFAGDIRLWFH